MAKSKKRVQLPSISTLILLVFFISFSVWAFSECSARRATLRADQTAATTTPRTATPPATTPAAAPALPLLRRDTVAPPTTGTATTTPIASRLYVTIDGLNLRKEPGLSSPVIAKLALFDEVYYDEAVTDSTFLVNLGKAEADEPYVRVRTKAGTRGWVYGAGVNYYRRANPDAQ